MIVKTGFKSDDKVTYKAVGENIPAVIVNVFPNADQRLTEYEIKVTTNRARTYRKGHTFRTTGNFLNKR